MLPLILASVAVAVAHANIMYLLFVGAAVRVNRALCPNRAIVF